MKSAGQMWPADFFVGVSTSYCEADDHVLHLSTDANPACITLARACIYCSQDRDYSDEHVPNRAIGKFWGNTLLKDRICVECNSDLGRRIDEQFGRSGIEAFWRIHLGLQSKGTPSPFERGSAGASRMETLVRDPFSNEVLRAEPDDIQFPVTPITQLKITKQDGGQVIIPLKSSPKSVDELDVAFDINSVDSNDISEIVLAGSSSDIEALQAVICQKFPSYKSTAFQYPEGGEPTVAQTITRVYLTDAYFRAIAKQAFHYFLQNVPKYRGDESHFSELRDFIVSGNRDPQEFVRYSNEGLLQSQPENVCHVFSAERTFRGDLVVRIRFFDGPQNMPRTWIVRLGRDPTPLMYAQRYSLNVFWFYREGKREGHDGEVTRI